MSSVAHDSPSSVYSYPSELTVNPYSEDSPDSSFDRSRSLSLPPNLRWSSDGDRFEQSSSQLPHPLNSPTDRYHETMNDVNRAIQSANRALQSAQEAFESRRFPSTNHQLNDDVVDLTGTSPPTASTLTASAPAPTDDGVLDRYLSRMTHPDDFTARQTGYHSVLDQPLYGTNSSFTDEIPGSTYTGPDSLLGPRRRYDMSRYHILPPILTSPSGAMNGPRASGSGRPDEEAAIRRQRAARAQWEENQRRTTERQRLERQRQRLLSSPASNRTAQQTLPNSSQPTNPVRPTSRPSSASSSPSVEAVDLTGVEDGSSLAAALSKQRQDAVLAQNIGAKNQASNSGIGSNEGRTALTAYKCPICMEPPQNATTTSCGHLFCHRCIIDTLKWSENQRRDEHPHGRKVKGVCPVCRKELARRETLGATRTLIPLEIKMLSRQELKRKREEEEQKRREQSKGKGKMLEDADNEDTKQLNTFKKVVDDSGQGPASGSGSGSGSTSSGSSQKENRSSKRIKTDDDDKQDDSYAAFIATEDFFRLGSEDDFT